MTTIILNPEAVNALFPEGTEARLELQRTVLRKLSEQYLKNIGIQDLGPQIRSDIAIARDELSRARRVAVDEALKNEGFRTGWGMELNTEAKQAIANAVREQITATVNKAIADQIEARLDKIGGVIRHDVDAAVNRTTEAEVTRVVKERIQAVIEKLGAAA